MADKINYSHGDTGSQPPDGNDFISGERPQASYFDWYINTLVTKHNSVIDELNTIDSDNDGIVDEADTANLYKDNDIDTDGDGKVDAAEDADHATTADELHNSDARYAYHGKQEGGTVPTGDYVPIGTFGVEDGETVKVTQAMLTEDGFDTPAPTGINLIIVTTENKTAPETTLLSGDSATLYDDETGTPLYSYNNTSGAHQTAVIAINNGDLGQTGVGSDQSAYGGYIARVV